MGTLLTWTAFRPKTEIGRGMGAFAYFEDTEGNVQGIWAQA
jgi:predicted enzyme related to lactoylglutathione lyase